MDTQMQPGHRIAQLPDGSMIMRFLISIHHGRPHLRCAQVVGPNWRTGMGVYRRLAQEQPAAKMHSFMRVLGSRPFRRGPFSHDISIHALFMYPSTRMLSALSPVLKIASFSSRECRSYRLRRPPGERRIRRWGRRVRIIHKLKRANDGELVRLSISVIV